VELVLTRGNYINFVGKGTNTSAHSFNTYQSDGSRYMIILGYDDSRETYREDFLVIGSDEWPTSPFKLNTWTYISGYETAATSGYRRWTWESNDKQGYYLPEQSWVFIKDLDYSFITFGVGTSQTNNPWTKSILNASAFYVPKDAGTTLLTINQSDVITEENVCVIPKILDKCISSNSIRAANFANNVLKKFRFTGQVDLPVPSAGETVNGVYISEDRPIIKGKEYHTIPYSQGLYGQHYVCFDTTPETAANAANDEYSVFYDTT